MKLLDTSELGPVRRFTDADVYWSLYTVDAKGPISRSDLAASVGIGEGSIRNVLSHLKNWNLIAVKQNGITVTEEGEDFLGLIPMRPIELDIRKYTSGAKYQGMLVLGAASKITNGVRQRDIGIMSGATGCTTFVIRNGHVIMSPDWDLDENDPGVSAKIKAAAKPYEGDVVLLGSGNDWPSAMRAAVLASLDIL